MTVVWSGLAVGAIYALIAIEYNVVFIGTGLFNFAQAQLAVTGTFFAYFFASTAHLPSGAVIALSAIGCAALGMIEEVAAVRSLQGRGFHGELVTTLGAAVVMEGAALLLWGSQVFPVGFPGPQNPLTLLGGRVLPVQLVTVGVAVVVVVLLRLLTKNTRIGLACLATAENRSAAMLRGVNVRVLSTLVFGFAGALAGASGVIVGAQTYAVYDGGNALALMGFLALAIGGFGSQFGALVGGLGAGLIQAEGLRYIGNDYTSIVLFGMLLTVLLLRPQGLFGRVTLRAV